MKTMIIDRGDDGKVGHNQSVESISNEADLTAADCRQIAKRAELFLSHGQRTIYAADLEKRLKQGEKIFLLDIRWNEDYEIAHIPGAVNVEFIYVASLQNLEKLPKDGTLIVIICYTGHTASQVDAILNLLGYNAWTLRFGMLGWSSLTNTKIWSPLETQNITGGGFPTEGMSARMNDSNVPLSIFQNTESRYKKEI